MPRPRRWVLVCAAAGVAFFALLLVVHVGQRGGISYENGCVIGPEHQLLNAPAQILDALAPNPWVKPQRFGEPSPVGWAEPGAASWSAPAFVIWGFVGYALLGAAIGAVLGRVASRRH